MKKKTVKEVEMFKFFILILILKILRKVGEKKIARLHNRETMTFRNSDICGSLGYICHVFV